MELQCKLEDQEERLRRDAVLSEKIQTQARLQQKTQEAVGSLSSKLDALIDSCSQKERQAVGDNSILQGIHSTYGPRTNSNEAL